MLYVSKSNDRFEKITSKDLSTVQNITAILYVMMAFAQTKHSLVISNYQLKILSVNVEIFAGTRFHEFCEFLSISRKTANLVFRLVFIVHW